MATGEVRRNPFGEGDDRCVTLRRDGGARGSGREVETARRADEGRDLSRGRVGGLVEHVAEAIERYRAGELDVHDVIIHRYQKATQELWKFCFPGGSARG